MPLFQSSTVRISVFQNGIELTGDPILMHYSILDDSIDRSVECLPGRITIRVENLSDKEFKAAIVPDPRVAIPAGAHHDFHIDFTEFLAVELRWRRSVMSILLDCD